MNVAALSNYVTAPNSAVPKVMYGISYNGQQINGQTSTQLFFKFDESPSKNQTNVADPSTMLLGQNYTSVYVSYASLAPYNITSSTGADGVRIFTLYSPSTANGTGVFSVMSVNPA